VKIGRGLTIVSAIRIIWMVSITIFVGGGVGIVWWPSSQTIAATQLQAKVLYDEANVNEAEVRHAAELQALTDRMADDVRALSGQASPSAATAATLALLNREARVFAIDVRSIVPTTAPTPAPSTALVGTPIEIDVGGHFRNLLAMVSDLPRHNVLIEVNDVSLDDDGDRSLRPVLSAKIHATVFRYHANTEEEMGYASKPL